MNSLIAESGFLITKEDYIHMELEKSKYFTPKENKIILIVIGIIAVCCGTVAFITIHGSVYHKIGLIFLILTGFYVISYYDVIKPLMIKKKAENFYDINHKNIGSKNVRFYTDRLEVYAEHRTLTIPQKYIYKTVDGKNILFVFTDRNECVFFPKRIFSEEQLSEIRKAYHEKYVSL